MLILKKFINNKIVRYILVAGVTGFIVYLIFGRQQIKSLNVKKVMVEKHVVEKTISATGEVTSVSDVTLSFGGAGKISGIYVSEGENVKKGDLLASINTQSLESTVQAARDARDIAQRDLELFIQNYENHKDSLGGEVEYDISLRKQNEVVSQAQATYDSQRALLNNSDIYSPINGIAYSVTKKAGENASPYETIVKVADLDALQFEVALDQEDFGAVKLGQNALVDLDAYPNERFSVTVAELPSYADVTNSSRFTVKLNFNKDNILTPLLGMTGDVHITVASSGTEVDALFYDQVFTDDDDKYFVWIVDDKGLIAKQNIEIGLEGDIYYEIKSNVDKHIIIGLNEDIVLKDGFKAVIAK